MSGKPGAGGHETMEAWFQELLRLDEESGLEIIDPDDPEMWKGVYQSGASPKEVYEEETGYREWADGR